MKKSNSFEAFCLGDWLAMKKLIAIASLLSISMLVMGCSKELTGKGEDVAGAFANAADNCLLDVRDKDIPYTKSFSCKNLSGLHLAAINVGNPTDFSTRAREDYNGAFKSAWTAVALNNYKAATGYHWEPTDRIW